MGRQLPTARAVHVGLGLEVPARPLPRWLRWSVRLHDRGAQLGWLIALVGVVACWFVVPTADSLVVLGIPLVALAVAFAFMRRCARLAVLRHGRAVLAEPVPHRDDRVTHLAFTEELDGTVHRGELTTLRRRRAPIAEPVVYQLSDPHHAVALADLPGRPVLRDARFVRTALPIAVFVLPASTLTAAVVLAVKCLG